MKKNQRINDYFIVKHPVECTHHAHTHTLSHKHTHTHTHTHTHMVEKIWVKTIEKLGHPSSDADISSR